MPSSPRRPRPGAPASSASGAGSPRRRRQLTPSRPPAAGVACLRSAGAFSPRSPGSAMPLQPLSPSHDAKYRAGDRIRPCARGPARVELSPLRYSPRQELRGKRGAGRDPPPPPLPTLEAEQHPYRRPPIEILKMLHRSMRPSRVPRRILSRCSTTGTWVTASWCLAWAWQRQTARRARPEGWRQDARRQGDAPRFEFLAGTKLNP